LLLRSSNAQLRNLGVGLRDVASQLCRRLLRSDALLLRTACLLDEPRYTVRARTVLLHQQRLAKFRGLHALAGISGELAHRSAVRVAALQQGGQLRAERRAVALARLQGRVQVLDARRCRNLLRLQQNARRLQLAIALVRQLLGVIDALLRISEVSLCVGERSHRSFPIAAAAVRDILQRRHSRLVAQLSSFQLR
jgi:hypothetical protein